MGKVKIVALVALLGLLLFVHLAQARELPSPPQPSGYYQMEPGEVFSLQCPDNPDSVQPAVNVHNDGVGQWLIIVGCPEVVTARELYERR